MYNNYILDPMVQNFPYEQHFNYHPALTSHSGAISANSCRKHTIKHIHSLIVLLLNHLTTSTPLNTLVYSLGIKGVTYSKISIHKTFRFTYTQSTYSVPGKSISIISRRFVFLNPYTFPLELFQTGLDFQYYHVLLTPFAHLVVLSRSFLHNHILLDMKHIHQKPL